MKKIILIIASILAIPILALAVNITVPSAPTSGFFLVSTTTGAYVATSSNPLYVGSVAATSTATSTFAAGVKSPCFSVDGINCLTAGATYGATYPIILSGANFGIAFGTTTPNIWNALQTFNGGFIDTASSTITSTLTLSSLGTPAGTFLAADPNGKIIATTTPSGGGSPGGSSGDIQTNNSGSFGGVTLVPLANGGTALANTITTLTTNGTITAMPVATSIIRYNNGSTVTIEGIAAPSGPQRIILQAATTSVGFTLKNQNAGATATNRLELQNGQDLAIGAGTQVELFYNTVDQRWNLSNFRSPVGISNGITTQNIFSNSGGIPTGVGDIVFGNGAVGAGTFNGSNAVIFGTNAAKLATSPNDLIAIGNGACQAAGSGANEDICLGTNTGSSTSSGGENLYGGADTAQNATTANENVCWGANDCLNLSTASQIVALGFDAGGMNSTGSDDISIGAGTQPASSNLSNTVGIGTSVRPTLSNTADIGGTSDPLDVGIDNDAAAYPLDVNGNINTNGQYLVNGVSQSPWLRTGNAGTTFGSDILGTTDFTDLGLYTNDLPVERITASGLTGFQQSSPKAVLHAGSLSVSVGAPASVFATAQPSASGYTFGSGDKDYAVYGSLNLNGTQIYSSSGTTVHFSEPSSSTFDPTGGSASFTGGSGYTASGYDFSGTVWALYGGQTLISVGNASISDSGSDPNDGSTYDVGFSWGAPPGASPDAYLLQMGGSNPNSGQYEVVSGTSLDDNGSGWGGSPSFGSLEYTVSISYGVGASATSYRVLNTTNTTYIDDLTPTQTVVDDNTWTGGSTVTPTTGDYPSFISDGTSELAKLGGDLGIFGAAPVGQQSGDLTTALGNYGLVTGGTMQGINVLYGDSSPLVNGSSVLLAEAGLTGPNSSGIDTSGNISGNSLSMPQISTPGTVTGKLYWSTASGCLTFQTGCVLLNSVALSGSGQVTGTLGANNGGTGFSSFTKGDILYAPNTSSLSKLAIGTGGNILSVSNGIPAWTATSTLVSGLCGSADLVGQTAAAASITTCTPTATTTLLISPYLTVNSIATDVEQIQVTYTDETNTARTQILSTNNGLSSLTAIGAFLYPTVSVRPMKNTAVTVLTVLTTSIGTINYDVGASIKYDR